MSLSPGTRPWRAPWMPQDKRQTPRVRARITMHLGRVEANQDMPRTSGNKSYPEQHELGYRKHFIGVNFTCFLLLFNMTIRTFKITYVTQIIFLSPSTDLHCFPHQTERGSIVRKENSLKYTMCQCCTLGVRPVKFNLTTQAFITQLFWQSLSRWT